MTLGRALLRRQQPAEVEAESKQRYAYLAAHVAADDGYLRGARKDLVPIEAMLGGDEDAARSRAELTGQSASPAR